MLKHLKRMKLTYNAHTINHWNPYACKRFLQQQRACVVSFNAKNGQNGTERKAMSTLRSPTNCFHVAYMHVFESCVNHLAAQCAQQLYTSFASSFWLEIRLKIHTNMNTTPDEHKCLLFIQFHMLIRCDLCANIIHHLLHIRYNHKSVMHCSC